MGAAGSRAVCQPSSVTNNKRKLVARVSRARGGGTGRRRRAGVLARTCPRPAAQSHPGYCSTLSAGHMPPACRLCRPGAAGRSRRMRAEPNRGVSTAERARRQSGQPRRAQSLSRPLSLCLAHMLAHPLSCWEAAASMHHACDARTHTRKTMRPCIWAGPSVINIGFVGATNPSMVTVRTVDALNGESS